MGILGFEFLRAVAGYLIDAGMSEEDVLENVVGHVSKVGNMTFGPGGMR